MNERFYSTQNGIEILKGKLENSKEQQKLALSDLKNAQEENTDLSENNEYLEAKDRLNYYDSEISKIEDRISKTVVVPKNNNSKEKVIFGCTVELFDVDKEESFTIKIVGEEESNFKENKISYLSPMARAIMGQPEGEEITFDLPNGKDRMVEILSIK